MRGRLLVAFLAGSALLLIPSQHATAQPPDNSSVPRPKYDANEPLAKTLSLEKSADLIVYALRQNGLPCDRPELARGLAWLRTHQRVSGGWFTPNADESESIGRIGRHDLAILNLGTAFAVMALNASEANQPGNEGKPSAPAIAIKAP